MSQSSQAQEAQEAQEARLETKRVRVQTALKSLITSQVLAEDPQFESGNIVVGASIRPVPESVPDSPEKTTRVDSMITSTEQDASLHATVLDNSNIFLNTNTPIVQVSAFHEARDLRRSTTSADGDVAEPDTRGFISTSDSKLKAPDSNTTRTFSTVGGVLTAAPSSNVSTRHAESWRGERQPVEVPVSPNTRGAITSGRGFRAEQEGSSSPLRRSWQSDLENRDRHVRFSSAEQTTDADIGDDGDITQVIASTQLLQEQAIWGESRGLGDASTRLLQKYALFLDWERSLSPGSREYGAINGQVEGQQPQLPQQEREIDPLHQIRAVIAAQYNNLITFPPGVALYRFTSSLTSLICNSCFPLIGRYIMGFVWFSVAICLVAWAALWLARIAWNNFHGSISSTSHTTVIPLDSTLQPLIEMTDSAVALLPLTVLLNLVSFNTISASDMVRASDLTFKAKLSAEYSQLGVNLRESVTELRTLQDDLSNLLSSSRIGVYRLFLLIEGLLEDDRMTLEPLARFLSFSSKFIGNGWLFKLNVNWVDYERLFGLQELSKELNSFLGAFSNEIVKLSRVVSRALDTLQKVNHNTREANALREENQGFVEKKQGKLKHDKGKKWKDMIFWGERRLSDEDESLLRKYKAEALKLHEIKKVQSGASNSLFVIKGRLDALESSLLRLQNSADSLEFAVKHSPCYGCWRPANYSINLKVQKTGTWALYLLIKRTELAFAEAGKTNNEIWAKKEEQCANAAKFLECMTRDYDQRSSKVIEITL